MLDEFLCPWASFCRRVVQLGQSVGRTNGKSEGMPCIVPRALLWERSRQSPVWGLG